MFLIDVKMLPINLLKQIFEEYNYCRKVIKKHFNKNLIMTEEDEENF